MATYNDIVDRGDAGPLIPEDAAAEILGAAAEQSATLSMMKRLPDMSRAQRRLPVWSSLPTAYFVDGDTGLKQTTDARWKNVYINAEELAVIVPIPENVLEDQDYDMWAEINPHIVGAFGKAVDQAVLYGVNAPTSWPEGIVEVCDATGHVIEEGTNGDLYDDLLGEGGVISLVEEDGFMVSGHIASLSLRAKMRGLRAGSGSDEPIFRTSNGPDAATRYTLDGETVMFPRNGGVDPAKSLLISGDWSQAMFAIRKDITFKVLTEAVIQDGDGAIVYNLAQQDMVALRVVFRLGWAVPNPINRVNEDEATRYPFAYYEAPSAS